MSEYEHLVLILTIPASLLGLLIAHLDEDSLMHWILSRGTWAAGTYLQFQLLVGVPGYVRDRRPLRRAVLSAISLLVIASFIWLVARWPAMPQEEPVFFFIRSPLWLLVASSTALVWVWSASRLQRV